MRRLSTFSGVLFFIFLFSCVSFAENKISDKYKTSYDACNNCIYQVGDTRFFDNGGENGNITNSYSKTILRADEGYIISLYFTDLDLPKGAKVNVYRGAEVVSDSLVKSFQYLEKYKNIKGTVLTVEYIPSSTDSVKNRRGWIAHLDRLLPVIPPSAGDDVQSQPEADCPFAKPLCQNITQVALAGQYTDLGADPSDDNGSCYSGTGDGGSVWYSFTPQTSGPIDFTISPTGSADYDFVVWDVTNGCANRNELACNYSSTTGATGLNSGRCNENVGSCTSNDCSNQSKAADCNRFNNRVNVTVGRQYAICVNFYSGSNDGFSFNFKQEPSSAGVQDLVQPTIANVYSTNCPNASNFKVKFSEFVKCSSIQNTDFVLAGHAFTIVNTNCIAGDRTKEIDITISPALSLGNYNISANNIDDLCGNVMNTNFNVV